MKYILVSLAIAAFNFCSFADSPITSTNFASAYSESPIVSAATTASGVLTDELMAYLIDEKNPIDVKMAVINQLGWDFDGKSNAATFQAYLFKKKKFKNEAAFKKKGTAHQLICMAYLKAMDNYFDVTDAIVYADLAVKKNSKSYTIELITGIIKAQQAMDSNWCAVYELTNVVRFNESLKVDMKTEAIDLIFEYMDLYSDSCE